MSIPMKRRAFLQATLASVPMIARGVGVARPAWALSEQQEVVDKARITWRLK